MRRLLVDDLIKDVRSLVDEENTASVDDDRDILPALNRAQDTVVNILTRKYNDPFLAYTTLQPQNGVSEYDLPEDAFEERLEKVEVQRLGLFYEVKRLDFRDISAYENSVQQNIPYYYCIVGSKMRLVPRPAAAYPLRLWYIKEPDPFVKSQGRITLLNSAQNYLTVDNVGPDITTNMDELESYVNIVDGNSGTIKATLQVQSIQGNKITFKSSPTRSTVLNKTVSSSIPTGAEQDDLICVVSGTCVPRFKKAVSNFLIQFAVADIVRKLGGSVEIEEKVKADFEKMVEKADKGRETQTRVRKVNRNWAIISRRFFPN
jgi:hypothetical protein